MGPLRSRHLIGLLGAGAIVAVAFFGCRNPASSSLPPSAISPPETTVSPLPKGDVYADETVPTSETPIETGDTLEVVIRRGAGEEKFASVVRENGKISVGFMEVDVGGVTAAVAEARVQEAADRANGRPAAQYARLPHLLGPRHRGFAAEQRDGGARRSGNADSGEVNGLQFGSRPRAKSARLTWGKYHPANCRTHHSPVALRVRSSANR